MEEELLRLCDEAEAERMREDARRVICAGGKRLRPALAYLCWQMGAPAGKRLQIVPLMCMLELMHTASLIHDDVVDGAAKRRGVASVNASSGRLAAVQSGDFLLAKAMEKLQHYRGTGVNETLAAVSAKMCRAELRQQRLRCEPDAQDEEIYYAQIRGKTASLLSASCRTGALAGGLPEEAADGLERFGDRFGLAFQILDDILDFRAEAAFGRPSGQDIRNGVLTLPVLLCKASWPEAVRRLLSKRDKTEGDIRRIVDCVHETDALARAADRIELHCEEARAALISLQNRSEKLALARLAETLAKRARDT
jgi:geranylgeranyl pyrophosphate synthase